MTETTAKNLIEIIKIRCQLIVAGVMGYGSTYERGRKEVAEDILKEIKETERDE